MHHAYWNDGWGWSWIPMAAMMILFWGGLIWLGITLLRRTNTPTSAGHVPAAPPPSPSASAAAVDPTQILSERLARGEIDVEEYRQRLDALRTRPGDR